MSLTRCRTPPSSVLLLPACCCPQCVSTRVPLATHLPLTRRSRRTPTPAPQVTLPPTVTSLRDYDIAPGLGRLDDLGWSATLDQIEVARAALAEELHYPEQLRLRQLITTLGTQAASLSFANATWKRHYPMRLCTSTGEGGTHYLSVYASHTLTRARYGGSYTVRAVNRPFSEAPLVDGSRTPGCLQRGQRRSYQLQTPPGSPELTSLGIARVHRYFVEAEDNHPSTLAVRRGQPPTDSEYDVQVAAPPRSRASPPAWLHPHPHPSELAP